MASIFDNWLRKKWIVLNYFSYMINILHIKLYYSYKYITLLQILLMRWRWTYAWYSCSNISICIIYIHLDLITFVDILWCWEKYLVHSWNRKWLLLFLIIHKCLWFPCLMLYGPICSKRRTYFAEKYLGTVIDGRTLGRR